MGAAKDRSGESKAEQLMRVAAEIEVQVGEIDLVDEVMHETACDLRDSIAARVRDLPFFTPAAVRARFVSIYWGLCKRIRAYEATSRREGKL